MTPKNRIIEGKNWIKGRGGGVENDPKKSDIIYGRSLNGDNCISLALLQKISERSKTTTKQSGHKLKKEQRKGELATMLQRVATRF